LDDLHWPDTGLPYFREPPLPWHIDFRRRWYEFRKSGGSRWQDQESLLVELSEEFEMQLVNYYEFVELQLVDVLDLLVSIERGHPIASQQSSLIELVNSFLSSEGRFRFAKMTKHVLKRLHPAILERESVKSKLKAALREAQIDRSSDVGKIVISLFPEWFD
jgi:hypothetical protein